MRTTQRRVDAYTVRSVGCIVNAIPLWFIRETAVAHVAKKSRICQHRKRAVARAALTREWMRLRGSFKLASSKPPP